MYTLCDQNESQSRVQLSLNNLMYQMMRLYKDPRGETVFTAHEEALQITNAIGGHSQNNEEVASLRKKIKRLENTIVEYKVTSL